MASLLASSEVTSLTTVLENHFDTFKRQIVIFKEPIKTIIDPNINNYVGYGDESNSTNYTLTPVSGIYDAMVMYKGNMESKTFGETKNLIGKGQVTIKVQSEAKNFIENGRNEGFSIDGQHYNKISDSWVQNYLGSIFYYYLLDKNL